MIPFSKINELLSEWATNTPKIEDFTVNNVLASLGLDNSNYQQVLSFLLRKNDFELTAKKMLLCPNNHKGETFLLATPIDEHEVFECHICGEEYHFNVDQAIVVFCFTDEFRQQELAEKKNFKREYSLC